MPEGVVRRANEALDKWAAAMVGLEVALVATPDGFQVASLKRTEINLVKLAAMTSSLIALTRAVGRELNFSACRRLILDTEMGTVVVQPVVAEFPTLICIVLNSQAVLGSALWTLGEISNWIARND